MPMIIQLNADPGRLVENEHFWSSLLPDQKDRFLTDSARVELRKVLRLVASRKLGIDDASDIILQCAKIARSD